MADRIKGITVEIGGDVTGLDKALKGVNKESRDLQTELRQVERLLKLDPKNTELLKQKQELLGKAVGATSDKLEALKLAQRKADDEIAKGTEIDQDQYRLLQREIVQTEQKLKGLASQANHAGNTMSEEKFSKGFKIGATAIAAGAVAAGAAVISMTMSVMENADELQKQSDITGLSAERLQELKYIGNNLGVDLDTITGAQTKLTKSMYASKDGTGAQAKAFAELGISVTDNNGNLRDAKDVMLEAFDALGSVGNETERDALAMQIFGKSAMELNPMIKAGSEALKGLSDEARANGAVMSDESVAAWDTLGDTIDNTKSAIMGTFGEALAPLLPGIIDFFSQIIGAVQSVVTWFQNAYTALNNFVQLFDRNNTKIGKYIPAGSSKTWGIPAFANGGTLTSGSALVGEAGPELLTMMGGRAVVTPLTTNSSVVQNSPTIIMHMSFQNSDEAAANRIVKLIDRKLGAKL